MQLKKKISELGMYTNLRYWRDSEAFVFVPGLIVRKKYDLALVTKA